MARIRFTGDPKTCRNPAWQHYARGIEVTVSEDEAERWLRRGVAVRLPDDPPAEAPARRSRRADPAPGPAAALPPASSLFGQDGAGAVDASGAAAAASQEPGPQGTEGA